MSTLAIIKPFKPFRVKKNKGAQKVATVNSNSEDIKHGSGKSNSTSVYSSNRNENIWGNLNQLLQSDDIVQDDESYYIYRLEINERVQTGIFGCVNVEYYNNGAILKHELTRPINEDERTKEIFTQRAHAELLVIVFRNNREVTSLTKSLTNDVHPLYNFVTADSVKHTIWKVEETDDLSTALKKISQVYIADGHHRFAGTARAVKEIASENPNHTGLEDYNYLPVVLFPSDQIEIQAYNRIIKSIPENFFDKLTEKFVVEKNVNPVPDRKRMISLYLDNIWYGIQLNEQNGSDIVSNLDISLLHSQVLEPIIGIEDQRTDSNINFIGGNSSIKQLEKLVDDGRAELAVSMYPTNIDEFLAVSDSGQLMPPKSTWFEPKPKAGLLIHKF